MKKGILFALAAIVVIVLSGLAVSSALLPSNESVSSNESLPPIASTSSTVTAQQSYPPPPPDTYPTWTPYPTSYPTWTPYPTSYPTWTPTPTPTPTSTPLEGQPLTIPDPSSGKTYTGEDISGLPAPSGISPITGDKASTIGGPIPAVTGIRGSQMWILYNGVWTKNHAALYYGDWTYMLLYNDQGQWISTKETYPSGGVDTRNWGYLNQGYHYYRFIGDSVGWHKIVAVGSATGQSNVIWVYVWPTVPTPTPSPTFTVNAWAGSSYYYIGSSSSIYYSVSKPCQARVTYLKQGGNVVIRGPYYVGAGTHTDTGTIGYPKGMRTVVVDAWTSSGEYAYDVTSYNVW
jgi:hypothetical protein